MDVDVKGILLQAMKEAGADGLVNIWAECGCEKDDLAPGDCLSLECELAKTREATDAEKEQGFDVMFVALRGQG